MTDPHPPLPCLSIARKAQLLTWCEALVGETWLDDAEQALVKRMHSRLVSPIPFVITPDRQEALAALVSRIKPKGAVH